MESIYYVMTWACHRRCKHCYEERFRPYVHDELKVVRDEAHRNYQRIIDHFPETMHYVDLNDPQSDGSYPTKIGRIVLSGGEALLAPFREEITYPVIETLRQRYAAHGGVKIIVQTTGDLLTDDIVKELLDLGIYMISVSSIDDFHVGLDNDIKQQEFIAHLTAMFERHGMQSTDEREEKGPWHEQEGPLYGFFGATKDTWIGKLWPRGRAWSNSLPESTLADNFCNRWSGGLNFLRHQFNGSEVSVEPDGSVYPCCVKTKYPIGNLVEEALIPILDSLAGLPAFEAISMGHPERMGISYGWSEQRMNEAARTNLPNGQPYQNLCIACDRFHEAELGPILANARAQRLGVANEPTDPAIGHVPMIFRKSIGDTLDPPASASENAG